eukprot:TRINITY_DN1103_c0_g1_i1.p1 TRINITY_DN1103_c0_g1~~TRINITY_DN1103_c0_g1_i1.p1  ORF type:complete len:199 (+),score=53.73 TRINITY_DN1103_c0_g1_i1:186-782(+)
MKAIFFVLATVFVGIALCQTPSTPKWAPAFSASVLITAADQEPSFSRWFYDYNNNRERFDGMVWMNGANAFTETIYLGGKGLSGTVYYIVYSGDAVFCFYNNTQNYTLPSPNFSSFSYIGVAEIDYIKTNLWMAPEFQSDYYEYYETTDSREPVEFDFVDYYGIQNSYRFFEFDAEAQDPSLFVVPSQLLSVCNNMSN